MDREQFFKELGRRLQDQIKNSKYTQKELAEKVDLLPQNLSAICKGRNSIDAWRLFQLCHVMGVSMDRVAGLNVPDSDAKRREKIVEDIEKLLARL